MSECVELKNIRYKTMIHTGMPMPESKSESDLANIERVLEEEKNDNKADAWSRLDKTIKTRKLVEYVATYSAKHGLGEEESVAMVAFFKDCLDRKKLFRVKDVVYDRVTGVISDVPALQFNRTARHFTLRVTEKRVSTLKSLPKKKGATATTTVEADEADDE